MRSQETLFTVNNEFALTYEELVIAAIKVDWRRKPNDKPADVRRKFKDSLTQALRLYGYSYLQYEPFTERNNEVTDYKVEPSEWIDQDDEYQTLTAAIELVNEIFG
jgi:hypothetical protein